MKLTALPLACLLAIPVMANASSATPICSHVLGWLNNGSLASRVQPLNEQPSDAEREQWRRLNPERAALYELRGSLRVSLHDHAMQLGEVVGGGSCVDEQIEVIGRHNPESYPESDDGELRWSTWGTRDYLLKLGGELLIISGRLDAEHSQATLVSRLEEDGRKQPLCLFERLPETRNEAARGVRPELCQAVRGGKAEVLPWGEPQQLADPQQHSQLPYLESNPHPILAQDLDGDGNDELLARYDFDSGAGCGSSSQHLLLVDKKYQVLPRDGLNAELLERSWGPLSDSDRRDVSIFRVERRAYLLARLNWRSETLSLRALDQPGTELCHWRERPQYRLQREY